MRKRFTLAAAILAAIPAAAEPGAPFRLSDSGRTNLPGSGLTGRARLNVTPSGDFLFFARTPRLSALYATDGTLAGTRLVRRLAGASTTPGQVVGALPGVGIAGSLTLLAAAPEAATNSPLELWWTDGSAGGAGLLADLNPIGASAPRQFVDDPDGSRCFFIADTDRGYETAVANPIVPLYVSDGTEAGTRRLANMLSTDRGGMAWFNGALYFGGSPQDFTTIQDVELWRTDGTDEGTVRAVDVSPGSNGSGPTTLTVIGDRLFFTVGSNRNRVHITDGTVGGTRQVSFQSQIEAPSNGVLASINNKLITANTQRLWAVDTNGTTTDLGVTLTASVADTFVQHHGLLYFFGRTANAGYELWKTDGTPQGTSLAFELGTGPADGVAHNTNNPAARIASTAGGLLFLGYTPTRQQRLMRTDGSLAGTAPLAPFANRNATDLVSVSGDGQRAIIVASNPSTRTDEVWVTDGTDAGTVRVFAADPSPFGLQHELLLSRPERAIIFARGSGDIWTTDGTRAGTLRTVDTNATAPFRDGVAFGDRVMLAVQDAATGTEPWLCDGTPDGTRIVSDIQPGDGNGVAFTPSGGELGGRYYFAGRGTGFDDELWRTDGTPGGTELFASLNDFAASSPSLFRAAAGKLYFTATPTNAANGSLLVTDGNSSPTRLDLEPNFNEGVGALIPWGDRLIVRGGWGFPTTGFWSVIEPDAQVRRLMTTVGAGGTFGASAAAGLGETAYFAEGSTPDTYAVYSWRVGVGTRLVRAFPSLNTSDAPRVVAVTPRGVVFGAWTPETGFEPWLVTEDGATLLADINPGPYDSAPVRFGEADGTAFFAAVSETTGRELWRTDGTPAGTAPVADLYPGSGDSILSTTRAFLRHQGLVLFSADGGEGTQVWAIRLCAADFNGDGFSDFFDINDFVDAFERGASEADFNGDGFADFFDANDLLEAFERGC
jgi:ELWxxDGT repeat protein